MFGFWLTFLFSNINSSHLLLHLCSLEVETTLSEEQWAKVEAEEGTFPTDERSSKVFNQINASWISAGSIEEYVRVLR